MSPEQGTSMCEDKGNVHDSEEGVCHDILDTQGS